MVLEVRRAWVDSFDSRFSLTREELSQLLAKCPIVQDRIDVEQFANDTWQVMAGNAKSL